MDDRQIDSTSQNNQNNYCTKCLLFLLLDMVVLHYLFLNKLFILILFCGQLFILTHEHENIRFGCWLFIKMFGHELLLFITQVIAQQ